MTHLTSALVAIRFVAAVRGRRCRIRGAKQNRIVNLTILIAAKQTLRVPVSCAEAGRWVHRSREFAATGRAHFATGRAYFATGRARKL